MNVTINSNQNFNGQAFFIKYKTKYPNRLEEFLPKNTHQKIKKIYSKIEPKSYNIYIKESEMYPGFYEIHANKSYYNILTCDMTKRVPTIVIQASILKYEIISAINSVMKSYEKLLFHKK